MYDSDGSIRNKILELCSKMSSALMGQSNSDVKFTEAFDYYRENFWSFYAIIGCVRKINEPIVNFLNEIYNFLYNSCLNQGALSSYAYQNSQENDKNTLYNGDNNINLIKIVNDINTFITIKDATLKTIIYTGYQHDVEVLKKMVNIINDDLKYDPAYSFIVDADIGGFFQVTAGYDPDDIRQKKWSEKDDKDIKTLNKVQEAMDELYILMTGYNSDFYIDYLEYSIPPYDDSNPVPAGTGVYDGEKIQKFKADIENLYNPLKNDVISNYNRIIEIIGSVNEISSRLNAFYDADYSQYTDRFVSLKRIFDDIDNFIIAIGDVINNLSKKPDIPALSKPGNPSNNTEISSQPDPITTATAGAVVTTVAVTDEKSGDVAKTGGGTKSSDEGKSGSGTKSSDEGKSGGGTKSGDEGKSGGGTKSGDEGKSGGGTKSGDEGKSGGGTKSSDEDVSKKIDEVPTDTKSTVVTPSGSTPSTQTSHVRSAIAQDFNRTGATPVVSGLAAMDTSGETTGNKVESLSSTKNIIKPLVSKLSTTNIIGDDNPVNPTRRTGANGGAIIGTLLGLGALGVAGVAGARYLKEKRNDENYEDDFSDGNMEFNNSEIDFNQTSDEIPVEKYQAGNVNDLSVDDTEISNDNFSFDDNNSSSSDSVLDFE